MGQGTDVTFWGGSGFQKDFDLCNLEMLLAVYSLVQLLSNTVDLKLNNSSNNMWGWAA